MFFLLYRKKTRAKTTDLRGKRLEVTSSISSLLKLWKICHLYPGCTFVRNLQVPYLLRLACKAKPESKNASDLVAKWGVMVPGVPRGECGDWGGELQRLSCARSSKKAFEKIEIAYILRWYRIQINTQFVVGPHQKTFSVYGTGRSTNFIAWKLDKTMTADLTMTLKWTPQMLGKINNFHEKTSEIKLTTTTNKSLYCIKRIVNKGAWVVNI